MLNGLLSNFETIWIDNKEVYEAFLSFSLSFFLVNLFLFIYYFL